MQLIAKTVKGHKYWYLVQKGRKNGVVTNIKTIYLGSADRLAERLSTEGVRLAALTVVHNYVLQRADGTSAAHRFFGAPPKDLFTELCLCLPLPARPRHRRAREEVPDQAT